MGAGRGARHSATFRQLLRADCGVPPRTAIRGFRADRVGPNLAGSAEWPRLIVSFVVFVSILQGDPPQGNGGSLCSIGALQCACVPVRGLLAARCYCKVSSKPWCLLRRPERRRMSVMCVCLFLILPSLLLPDRGLEQCTTCTSPGPHLPAQGLKVPTFFLFLF